MVMLLARPGRVVFQRLNLFGTRLIHSQRALNGEIGRPIPNSGSLALPLRFKSTATTTRPKAHTGRAAPSKARAKKPSASKSKAKGTKANVKSRAAKPKAKPGPKKKKPTEEQKEAKKEAQKRKKARLEIAKLKEEALSPPKLLPVTAFGIVLTRETGPIPKKVEIYKNLPAAELEELSNIAQANKVTNHAAYEEWVKTHSPLQIKNANDARRNLRRRLNRHRKFSAIRDERQVKGTRSAYVIFCTEQRATGNFDHLKGGAVFTRIAEDWRKLGENERQRYDQLAAEDRKRYINEYTSVYGQPPPPPRPSPQPK